MASKTIASSTEVKKLPIQEYLTPLIKKIKDNQVTVIVAATGSGKSIFIPPNAGGRVMVGVPTIAAARSLVKSQAHFHPKLKVGSAVNKEIKYNDKTQVVYATYRHITNLLINSLNDMNNIKPFPFDTLMIDEAHIGSLEVSVITGIWTWLNRKGKKVPKLIIASATPNPDGVIVSIPDEKHPGQFRRLNKDDIYEIPVTSPYSSEIKYYKKNYELTDFDDLITDISKMVVEIDRSYRDSSNNIIQGNMIVFLPGISEIDRVYDEITRLNPEIELLRYASGLPDEELQLIYEPTEKGVRRVYLATNALETGVTVEKIGIVIDSCYEKRIETSASDAKHLAIRYISQDSGKQRAGRTGRVMPGVVIRMLTKEKYANLDLHRATELSTLPLHSVVIEMLAKNLNPKEVFGDATTDEDENEKLLMRIDQSINKLVKLGMLVREDNEEVKEEEGSERDYESKSSVKTSLSVKVTDMGKFAPHFEMSVNSISVLWHWINSGLSMFPGIVASVAIDACELGFFRVPTRKNKDESKDDFDQRVDEIKKKQKKKFGAIDDMSIFLKLWTDMYEAVSGFVDSEGNIDVDYSLLNNWIRRYSINKKVLNAWIKSVLDVRKTMLRLFPDIPCVISTFSVEGPMKSLTPILSYVYSDFLMSRKPPNLRFLLVNSISSRGQIPVPYTADNRSYSTYRENMSITQVIAFVIDIRGAGKMHIIKAGVPIDAKTKKFVPASKQLLIFTTYKRPPPRGADENNELSDDDMSEDRKDMKGKSRGDEESSDDEKEERKEKKTNVSKPRTTSRSSRSNKEFIADLSDEGDESSPPAKKTTSRSANKSSERKKTSSKPKGDRSVYMVEFSSDEEEENKKKPLSRKKIIEESSDEEEVVVKKPITPKKKKEESSDSEEESKSKPRSIRGQVKPVTPKKKKEESSDEEPAVKKTSKPISRSVSSKPKSRVSRSKNTGGDDFVSDI